MFVKLILVAFVALSLLTAVAGATHSAERRALSSRGAAPRHSLLSKRKKHKQTAAPPPPAPLPPELNNIAAAAGALYKAEIWPAADDGSLRPAVSVIIPAFHT